MRSDIPEVGTSVSTSGSNQSPIHGNCNRAHSTSCLDSRTETELKGRSWWKALRLVIHVRSIIPRETHHTPSQRRSGGVNLRNGLIVVTKNSYPRCYSLVGQASLSQRDCSTVRHCSSASKQPADTSTQFPHQ